MLYATVMKGFVGFYVANGQNFILYISVCAGDAFSALHSTLLV